MTAHTAQQGLEDVGTLANVATLTAARPARSAATDWLTASEAADYLRLPSVNALYQRVARGQARAHRLGRQFRFRRRDLDSLMQPLLPA